MTDPECKFRWYQFSLRTLLAMTTFVAVLCSIGFYAHWIISALVGAVVMVGGIPGWIVGRSRLGFAVGVVYGAFFLFCSFFLVVFFDLFVSHPRRFPGELYFAAFVIATLVGGVVGGLEARPVSRGRIR